MKAKVDPDLCTGCALCEDVCPEVFEMVGELAEAKDIVAAEPTIREGLRDVTVHPWRRMWFGG